jgi:GMP synthase (glutamine-hydrolysing)
VAHDIILYIGFAQPDEWPSWAGTYARHAQRFEEASGGVACLVFPFHHVTPERIARIAPRAVVFSGFARSWEQYDPRSFDGVAAYIDQATDTPMLGLCGSHQLFGFHFSGGLRSSEGLRDQPMRSRRPGEPIVNPDYHPEFFMERGFYELTLQTPDPIFDGCGRPPVVYESHYCEVKALPPGFTLLASTPDCRIQAMRHGSRPLVGLQFHPEDYTDRFSDGRTILRNFLRATD